MHKHKYILHRKRTVVCLSKIKPPRTSESRRTGQHRPISSINKKARKEHTGKSRTYGRKKADRARKGKATNREEKCRVLRFPRPGRTCGDPAGREIGFHCRRERQHSANHHVKTFRPRTWAQHRPVSRTTVPPWPQRPVPDRP